MKRLTTLILVFALLLSGCGNQSDPSVPVETTEHKADLWIVTDYCTRDMVDSIASVVTDMQKEYSDLTIVQEDLPGGGEEREARLEQLKVQIMSGSGPDVYILNTYQNRFSYEGTNALISDVRLAMENNLFFDISAYYDADSELEKTSFAQAVMDAGVVDGGRYVLPLRYNFPVLFVNRQMLDHDGLGNGLDGLVEAAETYGNQALITSTRFFYAYFLSFFSNAIDYENGTVTIDPAELAVFLEQYRMLYIEMESGINSTLSAFSNYASENEFWAKEGSMTIYDHAINKQLGEGPYALHLSSLDDLVKDMRIAKAAEIDITALPLTSRDGSLTATIPYCAAIGANCQDPDLAYAFVRQLLMKEYQWNNSLSAYCQGWPVLTENSWSEMNEDIFAKTGRMGPFEDADKNKRLGTLKRAEMVESDFTVLNAQIDFARFPFAAEAMLMESIDSQLNPARNPDAMSVDVEKLATEIIWELELHLAEG